MLLVAVAVPHKFFSQDDKLLQHYDLKQASKATNDLIEPGCNFAILKALSRRWRLQQQSLVASKVGRYTRQTKLPLALRQYKPTFIR
mmetsp:Transcript_45961/g.73565  ORF Transcript_45961/g.73565 Transcript_45961/m.73565 type:complete len:87 (-) Transcript_45961:750-1010(-)